MLIPPIFILRMRMRRLRWTIGFVLEKLRNVIDNQVWAFALFLFRMRNGHLILLYRLGYHRRFLVRSGDEEIYVSDKRSFQRALTIAYCKFVGIRRLHNPDAFIVRFGNREVTISFEDEFQAILEVKQTFIDQQYSAVSVKGRQVVDIGANIGDSAIYFALRGATSVVALEPYLSNFKLALMNINSNQMNQVQVLNEAAGASKVVYVDPTTPQSGSTKLVDAKVGSRITVNSLDSLVERFAIRNAVLKVDCEGCEYDLMKESSLDALRAFDEVIMEFHDGSDFLVKQLRRADFVPRLHQVHYVKVAGRLTTDGIIFAAR